MLGKMLILGVVMNICVFGAASDEINDNYIKTVEIMGEQLAKRGHNLVFGAGKCGLMGAAARGFKKGGAKITGVIPSFFKEFGIEAIFEECDDIIYTETMRERKAKMEDMADAFIVVPGGVGTFEEMFEVITLKQLGRHKKPIAVYNVDGYYDAMDAMMGHAVKENFIRETCKMLYVTFTQLDSLTDYIEADIDMDFSVKQLKNG